MGILSKLPLESGIPKGDMIVENHLPDGLFERPVLYFEPVECRDDSASVPSAVAVNEQG